MCLRHFNSEPLNVLGSLNVARHKPNVLKLSKMRRRRASEAEEGGGGGGGGGGGRPRASTGRMAGVSSIQQSGARGRTGSIQLLDSEISDSEDDDELAVLGEEEELPVEERLLKMNKMIRWDVLDCNQALT